MSSPDMNITYKGIQDRALDDARERMPGFPKENTERAWEEYISDLEDLDAMEIAHESSEWDWVIYYHRALDLCQAVPSDVLHDAESQWSDIFAYGIDTDTFGLYEMAVQLAAIIAEREIADAVEQVRDELLEMANNQLENL